MIVSLNMIWNCDCDHKLTKDSVSHLEEMKVHLLLDFCQTGLFTFWAAELMQV